MLYEITLINCGNTLMSFISVCTLHRHPLVRWQQIEFLVSISEKFHQSVGIFLNLIFYLIFLETVSIFLSAAVYRSISS